jgi:hypothetical protein
VGGAAGSRHHPAGARRARGAPDRSTQPPSRGGSLRRCGRRRVRRPLAGHGVRRRLDPRPARPAAGQALARRRGAVDVAGSRCPRGGTPSRHRPSRREAVEHPGRPQRTGEAHRLRYRPHRNGRDAHADGHGDRVAGLPGAGDRHRGPGRHGGRRVVDGCHHVPSPRRPGAVRDRGPRAQRALPHRQRGATASHRCRLDGAVARGHDGQGPVPTLVDGTGP